ncbi:MAG: methyltransferase domain-containing protein [Candidatus Eisenbacteria bacterium]|nr:methyltransferase domain-containing protein [Candidatus Eisenbacteria bacterium]
MSNDYVHGTHPGEQRRLADLNALVNRASLAALAPGAGETFLDVGSGLGQFARDVARVTRARTLGIERSEEQLARARALAREAGEDPLVEFRQGDALALPLGEGEIGGFDCAHARFVLEHLRDPGAAVAGMARAVRPGGRVVLEDDDHEQLRLWPEPPCVSAVWRAYVRTYDRLGHDPIVGRRLVQLLSSAGLEPRRIELLPFGACSGQPSFIPFVSNLADIFRGARETILETGGVSAGEFDAALAGLESFARRADAAFWYTICWAEGTRPPA